MARQLVIKHNYFCFQGGACTKETCVYLSHLGKAERDTDTVDQRVYYTLQPDIGLPRYKMTC